jgi:hypothetical protein
MQAVLAKNMHWDFHAPSRLDRVCLAVVIKRFTNLAAFIVSVLFAPSIRRVSVKDVGVSNHRRLLLLLIP